jgi:hypothetical protein
VGTQRIAWSLAVLTLLVAPRAASARNLEIALSNEENLETAGAPSAPMDVSKPPEATPDVPLSKSHRDDLLSQFKGLVHMGLKKVAYDKWEGREMADCSKADKSGERWEYRCEIITGEGIGDYYFFPSESRQLATLQELDIRVDTADDNILEDFRRPVQLLFGNGSLVTKPVVQAKVRGPIRHWNTGEDIAELFIDHAVRPEGSVRFVWMRSPLVAGGQASLPDTQASVKPQ